MEAARITPEDGGGGSTRDGPAFGFVRGVTRIWHRVPWTAVQALPHHTYRVTATALCGAPPQPVDPTTAEWLYVAAFVGPELRHCQRCRRIADRRQEGRHAQA